ncbi:hypothetical protein HQN87_26030 [Paenibacillus tritici]|uniref:Uncharacterized protein n=1 Tax=Paenibacillus tritici TaxID=1873425 RepID=A0ABX2DWP1_9BACL|nr:hypothetical protein [Paenibacillus tritici]NQX48785.1 hypothetical protein [Paenibacillus tritici]QUL55535.1 hypothetical protein KDC22_02855 [Paenibacillus tritici]
MVIYVIIIYVFVAVLDPYGLLKKRMKRDFLVCSALYLISFSLAFALAMHWEIPSPTPLIVDWVKRLY